MTSHPVKQVIEANRAIAVEDFDALMDFYADDAVLVVKPGLHATGKEQIRRAFVRIAEYLSRSTTRQATYVFRKSGAGKWLCVIDNSYGTDLLKVE